MTGGRSFHGVPLSICCKVAVWRRSVLAVGAGQADVIFIAESLNGTEHIGRWRHDDNLNAHPSSEGEDVPAAGLVGWHAVYAIGL